MTSIGNVLLTSTIIALLPENSGSSALPDYPLDDKGLETRADYYTQSGKYLGGLPSHSDGAAVYNCTELNFDQSFNSTVSNDTACISWTADVAGSPEREVGRCSCQSVMDAEYCDAWTCNDVEVLNFGYELCPLDDEDTVTTPCAVETVVHSTRCVCEIEDVSGNFCSSWVCLETDYDYGSEFGEYQCVRPSPSRYYCEAWTGVVENANEASISACACTQESDNSRVCLEWECEVRSMTKCSSASSGWCDIGFSIGIGGFFGSFGAVLVALGLFRLMKKSQPLVRSSSGLYILLGLAWMAAWSTGVVIWGGVDGVLCAALWWGAFIVFGLLRGCFHKLFS